MNKININVDMGEGFNVEKINAINQFCNISCGAHAGALQKLKE